MKHLLLTLLLMMTALTVSAQQSFTQALGTKNSLGASVIVHESSEIDALVNGKSAPPAKPVGQTPVTTSTTNTTTTTTTGKTPATTTTPSPIQQDEEEDTYVDHSKKVMRKSYKVTGYRVQVFAGGNSREDRRKAENIGNQIKNLFPTQPVYTHFYSPRWICRMGNYRTYEEAHAMLQKVKALGYSQAVIVKGKISVAY